MKKTYEKPLLYKESFEMADVISAACDIQVEHQQGQCGYNAGGGIILFISYGVCTYPVQDGYNGMCYNIPVESSKIFTSI